MLFLSYAEEDSGAAAEISGWLRSQHIEVFDWRTRRGGRFISQIEAAIQRADAFLALLSPSFLNSDWCGREKDYALHREQALRAGDPDRVYIHVLEVAATRGSDAGFLSGYDWVSFTNMADRAASFGELASRLGLEPAPAPVIASKPGPSLLAPVFRNRDNELEKVRRALTISGGPNFWLVIAPPKLGKTWFLDRIRAELAQSRPATWVARLVDLRQVPIDVRRDAGALLARLFEQEAPIANDSDALLAVAQDISRNRKSCLCLLDHAELLDKTTAATIRSCLSQIYHYVLSANRAGVRFGFIVASRREDEWMGVTPDPRMSTLSLTEFKIDVIQQALHQLADEMERDGYSSSESRNNAALVYRLTEGLPALLVGCLQWVQRQEWLRMERLASQELFDQLTEHYIRQELLTQDSLLPGDEGTTDGPLTVLEQAYRVLAPFRLFTQSHLRYYFEMDSAFRAAMENQQWSMEDLWKAISGTALLVRPLNEPWKEIHTPIRRLLHRHYYKTDDKRATAHSEARKFVEIWVDQQSGKEQVIGLIECLWHEATALRLRQPAELDQQLRASAAMLSQGLRESPAYTKEELRGYAVDRMRDDAEFQEAVGIAPGLFPRLVEIVLNPPQES